MRKLTSLIIAILFSAGMAHAGVVTQSTAQTVASNYYAQTFGTAVTTITLGYSENDANGVIAYYVFNINNDGGFVIVSAEDAGHPIIGISNVGTYKAPTGTNNNLDFWMKKRNAEITAMRAANMIADAEVKDEWTSYINNTTPTLVKKATHKVLASPFPSSTAYLVQSTWDQQYYPYPYNYFCPPTTTGSTSSTQSVTGCVATTMAQIMRYWQYPPKGLSSSSYCDCTSSGFTQNYGTLSADYAKHSYNWSAMALTPSPTSSVNTSDTDIARVMSDAGISVQMDYSPSGSGAVVIGSSSSACAQTSYSKYFGYTTKIMDGLNAFSNLTTWEDTIEKDLDHSRPVQYFGTDPTNGGHTWVCDGYNSSTQFHMNWGWSGASDGWYALNNLAPTGQPDNFTTNLGALIGILPPPATPVADFTANFVTIPVGGKVNFTDLSTGFPTSWSWTFTGASTGTSTVQNPSGIQYFTPGNYQVVEKVTNAAGSNTATKAAYIHVVNSSACDTLSNLPASAYLTIYGSPASGYISGCYGDTVQQEAEYFSQTPSTGFTIGSVYIYFFAAYSPTAGRSINVNIWDNTGTGGAPGKVIATKAVTLSSIQAADRYPSAGPTLVTFTTPVTVTTPYYVGVDFTTEATNYKKDTVAIVTDTNYDGGNAGTAWQYAVYAPLSINGWTPLSDASFWNLNVANAIWPVFCSNGTVGFDEYALSEGVKLYPNPTNGMVNAAFSLDNSTDVHVEVYNMLGEMVQTAHWDNVKEDTYQINLSGQAPGMYFVKVISNETTITKKIILSR